MLALYRSGRQADALAAYRMHAACSSRTSASTRARSCRSSSGRSSGRIPRSALRRGRARALLRCGRAPRRPTRKTVTVVVARIANAGELAGRLEPEVLRALFDRYGDRVRSAVDRHGGVARVESGRASPSSEYRSCARTTHSGGPCGRRAPGRDRSAERRPAPGARRVPRGPTAIDTGDVLVTQAEGELATGRPVTAADELERSARPGQILLGEPAHALVRELVEVEAVSAGRPPARRAAPGRPRKGASPRLAAHRPAAAARSAVKRVRERRDGAALHLLTVLGAAGVGKSRLVREFVESVESVATLLHGQCLPTERRSRTGRSAHSSPARTTRDRGDRARDAREALEELAAERPLVLVLDDLQWAEPPLLDLVEEVAATSKDAPILLVCLARPELLEGEAPGARGASRRARSSSTR